MKNAFIFHGTGGYPEENWFPWLKEKFEEKGYEVFVPQFPTPENQDPPHWFEAFKDYQQHLNPETIIVAHSGGCAFLLRLLETLESPIKSATFVAPPLGIMPIKYIEADRPFLEAPFDWDTMQKNAPHAIVFHSQDDPFICIENGEQVAQNINAEFIRLTDAGHFNAKAGYTTFDLLLEKLNPIL